MSRAFCLTLLLILAACTDDQASRIDENRVPERVIVISPALAEMLASLDLADRVMGIGEFGPWPQGFSELPVVGDYDDPNVEQAIRLRADAVLNVKSQAAVPAHKRLQKAGIEVITLDTSTYAGVFESLRQLGERFKREQKATQLIKRIRADIDRIRHMANDLPARRVLFVVGRDPVYVAGRDSHVDFLIRLVGGKNIAGDTMAPYQQISMETILERQPEVIIDASNNQDEALRGRQPGKWSRWPFLPAVKNNRVYWIDPGRLVIPGIRMAEMARFTGKLVHPEIFGEPAASEYQQALYESQ